MAITDDIFQGEDKTFRITNKDETGTVIDLDTLSEIIVRLLDEGNNTIQKYSKTVIAGFTTLTIASPATGIMDVILDAANTDTANVNTVVRAEVKIRVTATSKDSTTVVNELGVIRKSETISDL